MCIHHARYPVKAEAIKHVDVHVKTEIGEKETEDLMMAIVE